MPKNKSLIHQVKEVLESKLCIGEEKHIAKQQGIASDGIYSWSTYQNYLAKACAFVKWAKEHHGGRHGGCDSKNNDNDHIRSNNIIDDSSKGSTKNINNSDSKGSSKNVNNSNNQDKPRTLADCRKYVDTYLKHYIDQGYSPYTQKLIACALAKVYGCSTKDFIPTQVRHRVNITRSRKCKISGKSRAKFSESKNQEFVDFCKATGLRRHEIKYLKPENLGFDEVAGRYMLVDIKGKGGRMRDCPIVSPENSAGMPKESVGAVEGADDNAVKKVIERMKNTPSGQLVWNKIPSRADIHSYRADYCKSVYRLYARPIAEIPKSDRYYCRGDLRGVVYDKRAMLIASRALGHNRIGVFAGHYLYDGDV